MFPIEYANTPLAISGEGLMGLELRSRVPLARPRQFEPHTGQPEPHAALRSNGRNADRGKSVIAIPIRGTITPRPDMYDQMFGFTHPQWAAAVIKQLVADSNTSAIILNIDSPGGSVYGISELGDAITAAGKVKPVYAVAEHVAASAAYWIGSQARKLYVAPSGQVGSVGVINVHVDLTRAEEKAGVRTSLIASTKSPRKGERMPQVALSDDARADMQREVDTYYNAFVSAVARGRGVSIGTVNREFGQGRMALAEEAVRRGMADGVKTVEQLAGELLGANNPSETRASAAAPGNGPAADERTGRTRRMVADGVCDLWVNAALAPQRSPVTRLTRPSATDSQRWTVAVHEAGHVVCALALGCPVTEAFVSASNDRGNTAFGNPTGSIVTATAAVMAGGTSEALFTEPGIDPFGAGGSAGNDLKLIREQIGADGSTQELARAAARAILSANAPAVQRVAQLLNVQGHATAPQLAAAAGELKRFPGA